uniref:Uncharacterized protein n=1 Tax=Romanomermis culicivorax TaxID=13658 RepID=A0A915KL44_ROMCU
MRNIRADNLAKKTKLKQRIRDKEVESRDKKAVPEKMKELMDIQKLTVEKENIATTIKDI